ncbi:MAG: transcription antitermination factor NusB [Rhodobacteraceae bacterium]|nr:transcription antitermination factor NusB [Paracoccaceae bacterium]MCY4196970.1 transcription antitermination factor NusB [Paracoccaceae bacterium]
MNNRDIALARRMARLRAVQALFQLEATGASVEKVVHDFEESDLIEDDDKNLELAPADDDYFRKILRTAISKHQEIDRLTDSKLKKGWQLDRIDPTLRALFRAAGAELKMQSAPPRVVIDEYVEITKAFYPQDKSAGFVNAVLDNLAKQLRPEIFSQSS